MEKRIKIIRKYFALSQEQFAKKINKTSSFVSTAENGRCGLSSSTIDNICSEFGVNEVWLRTGEGEMLKYPSASVDKEIIGKRVKEVRKILGLTQKEFASDIGFHVNHVYNVENGKANPSDSFISSVAIKFNISIEWLKTGAGEMNVSENLVDEKLIEWLKNHPDIAIKLRSISGLD